MLCYIMIQYISIVFSAIAKPARSKNSINICPQENKSVDCICSFNQSILNCVNFTFSSGQLDDISLLEDGSSINLTTSTFESNFVFVCNSCYNTLVVRTLEFFLIKGVKYKHYKVGNSWVLTDKDGSVVVATIEPNNKHLLLYKDNNVWLLPLAMNSQPFKFSNILSLPISYQSVPINEINKLLPLSMAENVPEKECGCFLFEDLEKDKHMTEYLIEACKLHKQKFDKNPGSKEESSTLRAIKAVETINAAVITKQRRKRGIHNIDNSNSSTTTNTTKAMIAFVVLGIILTLYIILRVYVRRKTIIL